MDSKEFDHKIMVPILHTFEQYTNYEGYVSFMLYIITIASRYITLKNVNFD